MATTYLSRESPQPRLRARFAGLTLIELLVVIAVIGVLSGLLLPCLARAKSKAKDIVCLNTIRQAGISALVRWSESTDRELPQMVVGSKASRLDYYGQLGTYFEPAWICPKTKINTNSEISVYRGTIEHTWFLDPYYNGSSASYLVGSYTINHWLLPLMPKAVELPYYYTDSQITTPSETPVFADGVGPFVYPKATDSAPSDYYYAHGDNDSLMKHVAIPRHGANPPRFYKSAAGTSGRPKAFPLGGRNHVFFYDGHASSLPLKQLWSLQWHAGYRE